MTAQIEGPMYAEIAELTPAAVILNGAAGALLDRADESAGLLDRLRAAGFAPQLIPPEAGTLPERVALACASGMDMLIVAGGDGTIACAAQQAHPAGITLGILPFGTMNVIAKDLGLPIGDVDAAIAVLRDGRIREIDAAEVNGHLYLCASMIGLPARLARYREAGRGRSSAARLWYRLARAALRAFARYGAPRVVLGREDGAVVETRAAAVVVTPNLLNDKTGRALGRDRLDGGLLGIYTIRQLTLRAVIALAVRTLLGRRDGDPELRGDSARAVEIRRFGRRSGKAIRVINDGEIMLMTPPLRYRILPRALRVIAPLPEGRA